MDRMVFIGYEPRELDAFLVARHSLIRHSPLTAVNGLILDDMISYGHYYRRSSHDAGGRRFDLISKAPMATEFAISRFLTYMLAKNAGAHWALFMDCDMLIREDINQLFDLADDKYAVMCVKHDNKKHVEGTKMDNQVQTSYERKNWSSVMLINCRHPSNERLTEQLINEMPGRDLHQFFWLFGEEIGELPSEWNHLVGVDQPNPNAKIVHHTLGIPSMPGYENSEFADEWRAELLMAVRDNRI